MCRSRIYFEDAVDEMCVNTLTMVCRDDCLFTDCLVVEAVTVPLAMEKDLVGNSTLSQTTVSYGYEGVAGR